MCLVGLVEVGRVISEVEVDIELERSDRVEGEELEEGDVSECVECGGEEGSGDVCCEGKIASSKIGVEVDEGR